MTKKRVITYAPPGPVSTAFHASNDFVKLIMGPVGSGKTSSCLMELFTRAQEQAPNNNVRRTRWAVIRNTFPQLKSTTIRTYQDWFPPEAFGSPTFDSPITHTIKLDLADGTSMEAEFIFISLDGPDAEAKLKSLEVTAAFINEASEIALGVFELLTSRVGRFPAKRDGGATWSGIVLDTNPPDTDSWLYRIFEEERPESFSIYKQPPGDEEGAENIENLPDDYYERLKHGKRDDWINVYVRGQYGFSFDGKAIYLEYNDTVHTHDGSIVVVGNAPVYVGIDFGLTPAAVFAQQIHGQWRVIEEFVTESMGAVNFGKELGKILRSKYANMTHNIYGDPAGEQRAQTDENTPFLVLQAQGIKAQPAPSNDYTIRREAVAQNLQRLTMDGGPGLIISPDCRVLRKGMAGKYCYRRVQVVGDERYQDKPDKNQWSHVCEALQYLLLGAGEGDSIVGKDNSDFFWPLE